MLLPVPASSSALEQAQLLGQLKALLAHCTEAEMIVVSAWLRTELEKAATRRGHLRLLRTPSFRAASQPVQRGSFVELAGQLRRDLHDLPMAELVLLHGWVRDQLSAFGR